MISSLLMDRWAGMMRRNGHGGLRALVAAALAGGSALALLVATPAGAAQTPPPPAPGVTPSTAVVAAASASAGTNAVVAYTGTTGSVWMKNLTTGKYEPVGGRLIGGPSVIASATSAIVFGRGTDNRLWFNTCNKYGDCGSWLPLGGRLTSSPGAVFRGPGAGDFSVYVRGTDGAVWARDHRASGWGAWRAIGGRVLAGTAPAAAYREGTYVLVVGTDRHMYIAKTGVTRFSPAGGTTTATPALTAIPGALVGFARGTDNAGYYHRFLATSPGWHPMGGRFTSGLSAAEIGVSLPITYISGLGTDNHIYQDSAAWTVYPPHFSGWYRVS